ncbi:MAG: NupC/NupG family nucleoside CNT transporter [Sandaracinaceae bacterium]|nr:NupC/NupG family nucleoside CNT transporter [Sandaracinaceae bacterium]
MHAVADTPLWLRAVSLVGLAVMVALAWAISYDRKAFPWRIVLYGTGLQLVFGVLVLRTSAGLWFFSVLNDGVTRLLTFTTDGSRFLFGDYLDDHFTVALNVLPTIIFFSALMTVLYHLGVMQRLVKSVAWVMQRTLKTSGAETLSAAANIFVGQTEAPLVVKPFVGEMTQSELMAIMVGGFATVAGGVMAAYVGMLRTHFPDIAGHLIAASVLSAPAGLVMAKVILPETSQSKTAGSLELDAKSPYANVIDAAATGASDGLKLAMNVGAMLLAFMALVALVNWLFALPSLVHNRAEWEAMLEALGAQGLAVPEGCPADGPGDLDAAALARCLHDGQALGLEHAFTAWEPTTMQWILGWLGWPIAFVMGVPVEDCATVSAMLGERIVLNEFVAYLDLAGNLAGEHPVSTRAATILTYALCGFANLGSIAIQIGGIGAIAPERRQDLARLGMRAMIGGLLASYMTACVAGLLA